MIFIISARPDSGENESGKPRSNGTFAARLRSQAPSDRLNPVWMLVCTLLVSLGLAGVVVMLQALLSPRQSDTVYMHFSGAFIVFVIGAGAMLRIFMHWRAGKILAARTEDTEADCSADGEQTSASRSSLRTLRKTEAERLKKLRVKSVSRLGRIASPRELSIAEYLSCVLLSALGLFGVWYQISIFVYQPKFINERSALGSPLVVFIGFLAMLRLYSFYACSPARKTDVATEEPSEPEQQEGEVSMDDELQEITDGLQSRTEAISSQTPSLAANAVDSAVEIADNS
ncbi:MAG: hypothetical protein JXR97_01755 [Planctomycetes bacterium]|nr:hypothetical protein [Planctomycetota bacterium]